jgi:hypothetical protein
MGDVSANMSKLIFPEAPPLHLQCCRIAAAQAFQALLKGQKGKENSSKLMAQSYKAGRRLSHTRSLRSLEPAETQRRKGAKAQRRKEELAATQGPEIRGQQNHRPTEAKSYKRS